MEMLLPLRRFLPIATALRKFLLYILALALIPQLAVAVMGDGEPEVDLLPEVLNMAQDAVMTDSMSDSASIPATAPVMRPDTFVPRMRPVVQKADLDAPVDFSSVDSMVIILSLIHI